MTERFPVLKQGFYASFLNLMVLIHPPICIKVGFYQKVKMETTKVL